MNLPQPNTHSPKILIVEDDYSFSLELEMLIKKIGYELAGNVDNSAEALDCIFSKAPDLILMDIDINGSLSGLEIAQKITHLNIPILFITSYEDEETYELANQTSMVNFLVKPVHKITLKTAIVNAIVQTSQKIAPIEEEVTPDLPEDLFIKNALFFKKKNFFYKVAYSEIKYIEAEDKYCTTYTDKGEKFIARVRLSNFEEWLPSNQFMRVSRSYIVPLDKIDKINTADLSIHIGEKELLIGQKKFQELQKLIFKVKL